MIVDDRGSWWVMMMNFSFLFSTSRFGLFILAIWGSVDIDEAIKRIEIDLENNNVLLLYERDKRNLILNIDYLAIFGRTKRLI